MWNNAAGNRSEKTHLGEVGYFAREAARILDGLRSQGIKKVTKKNENKKKKNKHNIYRVH